ncbi:DUF917 domain-containing protein [Desulfurococcaceae archaeon MEX13E-LK6-19]|nr:DUF917 domain-containing protein [Desulfurococcaceae archaeon MEX13E-LK6-19]
MAVLRLSTREDFESLLLGAALYATGGGGSIEKGLMLVKEAFLDRNRDLSIYDVEELDGEDVVVSVYNVGSVAYSTKYLQQTSWCIREALSLFNKVLGLSIGAFIPVELGAGNTAVTLYAAGVTGKPVIDGDRVGRAAPEIHQDVLLIHGKKLTPGVAVSPLGEKVIVMEYGSVDAYESILRNLAITASGSITVVDAPILFKEAKSIVIKNTLSRCYEVGKLVLEAMKYGKNIVSKLVEAIDGWVIFHGLIEDVVVRSKEGFLVGDIIVKGTNDFLGKKLRVWVKNEHIIAWINDEPIVMPPDLITFVDKHGVPVLNYELRKKLEVYVLACRAPDVWRTEKGLEYFGPRHFGFDLNYIPVEKLVKNIVMT